MRSSPILAVALCAPALVAQNVITVPAGVPVGPVIASASPGDVIVLLGNFYTPFYLDRGVTILGLGTNPQTGTRIFGLQQGIQVNVPAGQRATLSGINVEALSWTGAPVLAIQSYGSLAIRDVVCNAGIYLNGSTIVQRVTVTTNGLDVLGNCSISDSVLNGRNLDTTSTYTPAQVPTPGLNISGPTSRVVATNVSVVGGIGGSTPSSGWFNGAPAVRLASGTLWLTDSALIGSSGGVGFTGSVALASTGAASIARTTLIDGSGAPGPSFGYQQVPTMVGMHCTAAPTRGVMLQAVAKAGSSQGPLGIVAGFDRTVNVLAAPFVEPVFGVPGQHITLALAMPAPSAQVPVNLLVPNVAGLLGVELWLQAAQFAAAEVRASAVVGGAIR